MMMTKQAQLKKQAYESSLKSRALSVLIYLIDRSNKELTCFPSISTVAGQLHISVSTVRRALRELEIGGYIKKDSRYRSNQGQTSNLYTLVLWESPAGLDLVAGEEQGETEGAGSGEAGGEIVHVTFETLNLEKVQKDRVAGLEGGQYQGNRENEADREDEGNQENKADRENQGNQESDKDRKNGGDDTVREKEYNRAKKDNRVAKYRWAAELIPKQTERKSVRAMGGRRPQGWRHRLNVYWFQRRPVKVTFEWTGEGVSLHPP